MQAETGTKRGPTGNLPKAEDYRTADHPIEPLFLRRWWPRAMNGEPISREEMLTLFEAARWAPSRTQPRPPSDVTRRSLWKILYQAE